MQNIAEFAIGDKVSYYNGSTFFKVTVTDLSLNPITNTVEYSLHYRDNPKGIIRIKATCKDIRQSKFFVKG